MEEFIFGIIIFVIAVIIQFFVKRASKNGSQPKKESPFSSIFEQIKNEFKETVNEYTIKEKVRTVPDQYEIKKSEKQIKEEITESQKSSESINQVKEIKEQLSSLHAESFLSPIEKINNLPAIQSAVIWKEILDQPKAYRFDDYTTEDY